MPDLSIKPAFRYARLGAIAVQHDDGKTYCFLLCTEKTDCNVNRPLESEANCSSNVVFVGTARGKACVPPSG